MGIERIDWGGTMESRYGRARFALGTLAWRLMLAWRALRHGHQVHYMRDEVAVYGYFDPSGNYGATGSEPRERVVPC